ncbi:hypothetical protein DPMN_072370 [Dreissena polymorpha]|uniref:Uncharacterized protein n=1 Tax=Dreissena polymorpha TaxID=45954 RepID=A0A9D3Z4F3_DREPO|nr:hypothetical protein DPMN_072370 [Dreissena polymorpha]
MVDAQRSMDIAKERGMSLKQILCHDLISSSPLFDGDLPAHVNKSKLIGEIESRLSISKWSRESLLPTHVMWTSCFRCDRCHLHNFPLWVVQSMMSSTQRQAYVRGQSTFILY